MTDGDDGKISHGDKDAGILRDFVSRFKTPLRLALTGSPMSNHLPEYYSMLDWVERGCLGKSEDFKKKFIAPIGNGDADESGESRRWVVPLLALHELAKDKMVRREAREFTGLLPLKTDHVIHVPLSDTQREMYSTIAGMADTKEFFKWVGVLRVLCNTPAELGGYLKDKGGFKKELVEKANQLQGEGLSSRKVDVAMFIIEEHLRQHLHEEGKVLIFSHDLKTLDVLGGKLLEGKSKGARFRFGRIDGKTDPEKRQSLTKRLGDVKDDGVDVLLISTRAGGEGLNMQSANCVIIMDSHWNPQYEIQAIARARRKGQTRVVCVWRLCCIGTIDEKLLSQGRNKIQLAGMAVDAVIQPPGKRTKEWFSMSGDTIENIHGEEDTLGGFKIKVQAVAELAENEGVIVTDKEREDALRLADEVRKSAAGVSEGKKRGGSGGGSGKGKKRSKTQ